MSTICLSTSPFHPTASPIASSRVVSSSSCPIPSQLRTNAWFNRSLTIDNSNKRKSSETAATTNNNRTKKFNVNRSITNTENDLIKKIESCRDAFELGSIMRITNKNVFMTDRTSEALAKKIKALASRMRVRGAAGLLNSLSKERVPNQRRNLHYGLMTLLTEVPMKKMKECKAKDMSMIVNALSKQGIKNDQLFHNIAKKAIASIGTFNAQDLANVSNAYAKMDHRHPHLFDKIASASIPIISTFNAQDLANTANAYARMDLHHPELFHKIASASILIISSFKAQELANTANA